MISIFAIISLCSLYIYAEYDRNKESSISKDMMLLLNDTSENGDISSNEQALIVMLTQDMEEDKTEQANSQEEIKETPLVTSLYTASNGKKYEYIGWINIPKINVNYPIFSETTVELLKVSVCRFHGGNPNEVGNLCIAGHNYRNKRFFSKVPTLEIGDIIEITDLSKRTLEYEIYDIHTVLPNNRDDTTQYTNGRKEVTLITCTDDSEQRVIVKCKEKV